MATCPKHPDSHAHADAQRAIILPPKVRACRRRYREHGHTRLDPYAWMQDLSHPDMQTFLKANNRHAEAAMAHTRSLRQRLLRELRALMPQDEGPPAYRHGRFLYRLYFRSGDDYPVLTRRNPRHGKETILLDGNRLARNHPYFALGMVRVSPRHDVLAYTEDRSGDLNYTLRCVDLVSGRTLPDRLDHVDASFAWANDNRTLFYIRNDPVTLRPWQVLRHVRGTHPDQDVIVYQENDPAFSCKIVKTQSGRFIFINTYANDSEEYWFLNAGTPRSAFTLFAPRKMGHEYELNDAGNVFVVRTNDHASGFRLCEVPVGPAPPRSTWQTRVRPAPGGFIEHMAAHRRHLAWIERRKGLPYLRILDRTSNEIHEVDFKEPAHEIWFEPIPGIASHSVRVGYTSLVTPVTYAEYHVRSHRLQRLQREKIPGYDPACYATERHFARSRDGTSVPFTVVYRRDRRRSQGNPFVLFGYGAYGTNIPLYFDQSRLLLLDRGIGYAMAHVRGGSELGPAWSHAGRLLNKPRVFEDFVACAEALTHGGLADPNLRFADSLSAGGVLIGTVINRRPDLFRGILLKAPFVDVLTTMAQPHCPLTTFEYSEWGHPKRRNHWTCMRAYSPYDNIRPRRYPAILATANLNDSQVACWEPAKWVARLRAANRAPTPILLRVNMTTGHAGTSGRLRRLRDTAFEYAFLLDLVRQFRR